MRVHVAFRRLRGSQNEARPVLYRRAFLAGALAIAPLERHAGASPAVSEATGPSVRMRPIERVQSALKGYLDSDDRRGLRDRSGARTVPCSLKAASYVQFSIEWDADDQRSRRRPIRHRHGGSRDRRPERKAGFDFTPCPSAPDVSDLRCMHVETGAYGLEGCNARWTTFSESEDFCAWHVGLEEQCPKSEMHHRLALRCTIGDAIPGSGGSSASGAAFRAPRLVFIEFLTVSARFAVLPDISKWSSVRHADASSARVSRPLFCKSDSELSALID